MTITRAVWITGHVTVNRARKSTGRCRPVEGGGTRVGLDGKVRCLPTLRQANVRPLKHYCARRRACSRGVGVPTKPTSWLPVGASARRRPRMVGVVIPLSAAPRWRALRAIHWSDAAAHNLSVHVPKHHREAYRCTPVNSFDTCAATPHDFPR